jgi:mRNA-degrading endonuclease toxin of MazEF toxin-antitoxin module
MMQIHRGEIYFADLGPLSLLSTGETALEIAKRRPVIVISTDALNRVSENRPFYLLVMPGTTGKSSFKNFATNVLLQPEETGLREAGVFLAHHVRSIDSRRLSGPPVGRIRGAAMERVERALRYTLALRG